MNDQHTPGPGRWLLWLVPACVVVSMADLLVEKHPHFAIEEWYNFAGLLGLASTLLLILLAKAARTWFALGNDE